jgi:serine protease Do
MNFKTWAIAAACLSLAAAQDGAKEQLRTALKDDAVKGDWIYDDLPAGYALAKKTGKPLMVVFRCVP